MSLRPHVGPLTTSVCRVKFWSHQEMCLFRKGGVESWGSWQGKKGRQSGENKKKKKKRHRMRNSKRGAVPVLSQLLSSRVITDVAWGEWRTNSGSGARCGPLIMRFELTSDPKPLWALCLLQLTSHQRRPPEEFILDSHDTTRGDFGKKCVFSDLFFRVCQFQTRQTLRSWSNVISRQRHLIALYDCEMNSYLHNPTLNFICVVFDSA